MRCQCGGTFKKTKLKRFDFTPFVGFPVTIEDVPGLKCDKGNEETLEGTVIDAALDQLALEVAHLPHALTGQHIKFLRKHLGLTQEKLAERLGLDRRETVADWETGSGASPAYDYILRALAMSAVATKRARQIEPAELNQSVRRKPAPKRAARLVIGKVRAA